ncbi:hypothetical protein [Streptomyces fractus]|uniref:hypothetical protein n=1 Tax=Streptomyces fractus TaxID=641806 RepID=UPI003CE73F38
MSESPTLLDDPQHLRDLVRFRAEHPPPLPVGFHQAVGELNLWRAAMHAIGFEGGFLPLSLLVRSGVAVGLAYGLYGGEVRPDWGVLYEALGGDEDAVSEARWCVRETFGADHPDPWADRRLSDVLATHAAMGEGQGVGPARVTRAEAGRRGVRTLRMEWNCRPTGEAVTIEEALGQHRGGRAPSDEPYVPLHTSEGPAIPGFHYEPAR